MLPGVAQEIVQLLYSLLPGFLAAWIFYGLSAHPKPSPFERTVQALIYTMIVQVLLSPIRLAFVSIGNFASIGNWTQNVELPWSVFIAVFIGISFAGLANNSTIHSWLGSRNWRFAKDPIQGDDAGWRYCNEAYAGRRGMTVAGVSPMVMDRYESWIRENGHTAAGILPPPVTEFCMAKGEFDPHGLDAD